MSPTLRRALPPRIPLASLRRFAAALACAAGSSTAVQAELLPDTDSLRFHGFGTLGVAHANAPDGWSYRRDVSQAASRSDTRVDIDSRLGLQVNYAISDQLEFVGQGVLKRPAATASPLDSLEWAFVSWRPTPSWQLRVGRTNTDLFLLSDYRNVGFAYTPVRPVTDFYGVLPLSSMDGADLSHEWTQGQARWRAKLAFGRSRYHVDGLPSNPPAEATLKSAVGVVLTREAEGLLLRATYGQADVDYAVSQTAIGATRLLGTLSGMGIPGVSEQAADLVRRTRSTNNTVTYSAIGMAYELEGWLLSAELMRISGNLVAMKARSGYVLLGRRFGDVTAYGTLSAVRPPDPGVAEPQWQAALSPYEPYVGPGFAAMAQLAGTSTARFVNGRMGQSTLSLGARWDVHPQVAVKVQLDHVRTQDNGNLLWSDSQYSPGSANVVSATVDFIF